MTTTHQLTFSDIPAQSTDTSGQTPDENGTPSPLDLFFEQFNQLITRPADIPRLNDLILQLAVQGKLVPQNPDDEPADRLLERIRAEKARLKPQNKSRKGKKK